MNQKRNESQYKEWVIPNWTSFIPVLAVFPTLWLTLLPIDETLGVLLGIVLTVVVVLMMLAKSARISVDENYLSVAQAVIERKFVVAVEVVSQEDGFAARGSGLDPRAWIHFQGSVKTMARVFIDDPEDPTPYWLFSTRRPEELANALGVRTLNS